MALPTQIQDARHVAIAVTCIDADGDAVNLTDATLTGRIEDRSSEQARDVDGVLSITNAVAGEFTWAFGEVDLGTPGLFLVQFIATYGDALVDASLPMEWEVKRRL